MLIPLSTSGRYFVHLHGNLWCCEGLGYRLCPHAFDHLHRNRRHLPMVGGSDSPRRCGHASSNVVVSEPRRPGRPRTRPILLVCDLIRAAHGMVGGNIRLVDCEDGYPLPTHGNQRMAYINGCRSLARIHRPQMDPSHRRHGRYHCHHPFTIWRFTFQLLAIRFPRLHHWKYRDDGCLPQLFYRPLLLYTSGGRRYGWCSIQLRTTTRIRRRSRCSFQHIHLDRRKENVYSPGQRVEWRPESDHQVDVEGGL
jgi:hypothetical protein